MRGLLSVGAVFGLVIFLISLQAVQAGLGDVTENRYPWRDGESRKFTQGWNGSFSHSGQFATDWGNDGAGFDVVAATEGDAVCTEWDGISSTGTRVDIAAIDGATESYFHLASCDFSAKHVEQGEKIGPAGNTGFSTGIHLHYVRGGSHCLSTRCDFYGNGDFLWYESDNAGPGVNDAGDLPAWNAIRTVYTNLGHYLCGEAWDCFGSSIDVFGEGRLALANSPCAPEDCGWSQQFKSEGGVLHNFSWPEPCTYAYWVPDRFYLTWLNNAWLGYPRSNVLTFVGVYYQFFQHGYLEARVFGGNAVITAYEQASCVS